MIAVLMLALLLQQAAATENDHEYTDLVRIKSTDVLASYIAEHHPSAEKQKELQELFRFRDFAGKAIDGDDVNFHLPQEKGYKPAKLLIMVYVAEWCKNCDYEAPYLQSIYQKYKSRGLRIVARTEYSELQKMKKVIARDHIPYPVIRGSEIGFDEREKIRMETFQYLLRSTLGDQRRWGLPFSIIVVNGDLENPYAVTGEMKEDQVNRLIEGTLFTGP